MQNRANKKVKLKKESKVREKNRKFRAEGKNINMTKQA